MFSLSATVIRIRFIDLRPEGDKTKHHPPAKHRTQTTQLQRRQPTVVASAATSRGDSTAAKNDSWRSIALQSGPKRRPFGAHPAANEHDRRDDGDQHDAEQNRIFDERSAFLVILELLDQLRRLTHVSLQFVSMPNALFARSSA
jgi:hypothetical protein